MKSKDRLGYMIRLARMDTPENRALLRIAKTAKNDYIALTMIRRFFMVTVAYVLLVAAFGLFSLDFIMTNFNRIAFRTLFAEMIIGYIVFLAVYFTVTYISCSLRYARAKRVKREYEDSLKKIDKIYDREERALLRERKEEER